MHPIIREIQKSQLKKLPEIRVGDTVKLQQKIREEGEEKDRLQNYEGLVIAISSGEGVEKTMTVRKIVEGVGVEKVFPMHSPVLAKIEVKKRASVRRAKLYYMRGLSGKSARLDENFVNAEVEAPVAEAPKAEANKAEKAEAAAA